jgi:hypothetical protein
MDGDRGVRASRHVQRANHATAGLTRAEQGQAQAVPWFAEHGAEGYTPPSCEELVAAQYAGKKAALRPILDAVVTAAADLGGDLEAGVRETHVSLHRRRQFAIVRASTQSTANVGLVLPEFPASERLGRPRSLGSDRMIDKVTLRSASDVDDELVGRLRDAHEADAR